jgi:hypothetical protein
MTSPDTKFEPTRLSGPKVGVYLPSEDAMHFILLLATLAHGAEPPLCAQDLSNLVLPAGGTFIDPEQLQKRALRPGLMRFQEDLCHCLPWWSRSRPASVKAHLHIDPNSGKMRVEYIVKRPWSRPIRRMMKCMGEPTLTFEPIPYVSDIVLPGGQRGTFPHYPLVVELDEERARKARLQPKD